MKKILTLAAIFGGFVSSAYAANISVVAAENQYGSVAEMIGGDKVDVTSIISNADGDPHTFVSSVKNSKILENADVIVYNGADYDTWINPIIKNNKNAKAISAQDLVNFKAKGGFGINPHLWYNPQTFPAVAERLEAVFSELDPADKAYFEANLKDFKEKYAPVYKLIDTTKEQYEDTPVTATEPLYGYMATALNLDMMGLNFQWVIMNDSEPTPKMMIDYQNLFKEKKVKVLFYNEQVTDNVTKNILALAKQNDVEIVGLTETMPQDKNAISWMIDTLEETQQALEKANSK
mgnify:CR=1 FL=1